MTSLPVATPRTRAQVAFGLSTAILAVGITLAARRFPGGFDWVYTVVSAVASRRHNPDGARYLAAGLALALPLLWPVVSWISARDRAERGIGRFGVRALRAGILLGALVGVERLVFYRFSEIVPKGHEVVALACFVASYAGVIALEVHRARRGLGSAWPAWATVAPLAGVGMAQLGLYLDPRDLGWVDPSWRELGVPAWRSFAFWQWLALGVLWAALAHLVACGPHRDSRCSRASSAASSAAGRVH